MGNGYVDRCGSNSMSLSGVPTNYPTKFPSYMNGQKNRCCSGSLMNTSANSVQRGRCTCQSISTANHITSKPSSNSILSTSVSVSSAINEESSEQESSQKNTTAISHEHNYINIDFTPKVDALNDHNDSSNSTSATQAPANITKNSDTGKSISTLTSTESKNTLPGKDRLTVEHNYVNMQFVQSISLYQNMVVTENGQLKCAPTNRLQIIDEPEEAESSTCH